MTRKTTRTEINPATMKILEEIAASHMHLDTLETRSSDSLDFSDQAVWCIRDALAAAFEAGRASKR